MRWGIVLVAWLCVTSTVAAADPEPPPPSPAKGEVVAPMPAKPSEAPLPSCLDQTIKDELGTQLKPRGVQKRDFAKNKKIVLVAHGGLFGGDVTSSSWIAGGSLGFFLTEDFGLFGEFDLTPLRVDLDSPLAKFFADTRFDAGMGYLALGNAVWSPIHMKMKTGGGIVHADLLLFAGGGRLFHDAVQGLSFDAGTALDFFVTRAVTVRFELRDLMSVIEVAGETRYTNNLVATLGLAIYIPSGL